MRPSTIPPMNLRGSWIQFLTCALTVSSVSCSKSSKQTIDASPSSDSPIADAGSERVVDGPAPGADAAKDAAPVGDPEVATLCPGLDKFGAYGAIVAGTTPFPDGVELLVPSGSPKVMVVTDGDLYWANDRSIHRMTLGDGVDKTILDRSSLRNTISRLAIDATNLYFTEIGDNGYRVAKLPLDGSTAPVTLGGSSSPSDIAVAGAYVYYYDANLEEIDRVPIAGGTITTLVRNVAPDSFCLANEHIYFTDQVTATEAALLSISVNAQAGSLVDGGTDGLVTLATNNGGFSGPCFDGGNLYYMDSDKVMRMPAGGGTATVLATPQGGTTLAPIATSGGHLYWASASSDPNCSNITRAAMDGSAQVTIVHAIEAPWSFALNATHLFMMTGGKQILRVPR